MYLQCELNLQNKVFSMLLFLKTVLIVYLMLNNVILKIVYEKYFTNENSYEKIFYSIKHVFTPVTTTVITDNLR